MSWYNSSWSNRVKVTALATKVDGDLTDFPIYVNLYDLPAGFHTNVKSDGSDIRVTTADGSTEVPREVVYYASGAGELHFKGDVLNSTDVDFYIYYGNPSASDYASTDTYGRNNVWKSAYKGVYHLQESGNGTSGEFKDSTSNGNNGTGGGGSATPIRATGKLSGYGQYFDGGDLINLSNPSSLNVGQITVSSWVRRTTTGSNDIFFTRGNTNTGTVNYRRNDTTNKWDFLVRLDGSESTQRTATSNSTTTTSYTHLVGTYDGTELKLYVDGVLQTTSAVVSGAIDLDNYVGNNIGKNTASSAYATGDVDEFKIANAAQTAAWISTEYNNQSDTSTFFTIGTQEDSPSSATLSNITSISNITTITI